MYLLTSNTSNTSRTVRVDDVKNDNTKTTGGESVGAELDVGGGVVV